ncbi:MAG: flavin monoamine oxidase family protein [Gammaproteobacteria bacterium]
MRNRDADDRLRRAQPRLDRREALTLLGASAVAGLAPAAGHATTGAKSSRSLPTTQSDVVLIGAGLSGLNAALNLEEQGLKVTVLEGRTRIGGRLHTLNEITGAPEAGGNGIGHSYARLLDLARRLGVELVPERLRTEPRENSALHVRGQFITMADWPESPFNPHPDALRKLGPWQVIFGFLSGKVPPMELDGWQASQWAHLDVPVAQYLREQGLNDETLRLANQFSSYGTNLWQSSLLQLCHVFTFARKSIELSAGRGSMSVKGGNQRMPEAMARALKGDVLLGRPVAGIRLDADGVEVRCSDGSRHRARFCVMSAPFSALRLVPVDPGFRGAQAEAVETLPYHHAFQVHFAVEKPFWEKDGLPPSFWSDGPIERFNALSYGPNASISSFMHYSNGDSTSRFDRLPLEDAARLVLDEVERVRPAARGALRVLRAYSWQQTPFSGGAYASWAPGQIPRFAIAMRQPHERMHLCGEHTSVLARGMEGALESGERAALEILERA